MRFQSFVAGVTDDGSKSPSSPKQSIEPTFSQPSKKQSTTWSPSPDSDEFDFGLQENNQKDSSQPADEPENEWARFQAMTSGIDNIVKQKKEELDTLKESSYYQRKKTQDEIDEDAKIARPKTLVGKRRKKWKNLDEDGFEEHEGVVGSEGELSEDYEDFAEEDEEHEPEEGELSPKFDDEVKEEPEEPEPEPEEEIDQELVNEQLAEMGMKLNEIPDSPIDDDSAFDVFDTKVAENIVEKAERERKAREKAESDKVKFGYIAAAADILSGKSPIKEPGAPEQSIVRKRRRRGDGVNLLPEEPDPPVVIEEPKVEEEPEEEKIDDGEEEKTNEDDEDFEKIETEEEKADEEAKEEEQQEEEEEEDDPFDAAFDELAKESLKKVNIDEITADLFNEDLFDTSAADAVLNLASLTNVVEKKEEEEEIVLDTFDDKDPFDTSAYEHITKDFEEDLEFESLAKRDPNESNNSKDIAEDPGRYLEKCGVWGSLSTDLNPSKSFILLSFYLYIIN